MEKRDKSERDLKREEVIGLVEEVHTAHRERPLILTGQRRSYPLRRQLLQEKPGLTDEKVIQLVHQSDRRGGAEEIVLTELVYA